MEMLISFSSRTWHLPTLPKVPKAGSMTIVLLCFIGQQTHLTWTQRIYGVLSKGRWETPDPTMQMSFRPLSKQPGLHYTCALPQADCLYATPHWCSALFRSLTFLFKISFFYWSYVIFKFSETVNLGFSLSVNHNHKMSRNKGLK